MPKLNPDNLAKITNNTPIYIIPNTDLLLTVDWHSVNDNTGKYMTTINGLSVMDKVLYMGTVFG